MEPGREERLDLPRASWLFEPGADRLPLDDDEGGHDADRELREEVRPLLEGDAIERERHMVAPTLQNLRQEAVDAPAAARESGMEKDEARFGSRTAPLRGYIHTKPPLEAQPTRLVTPG